MWKTASASPPSGGRPRLVSPTTPAHPHKEPCTKIARAGTCSFFSYTPISHSREVSVFIYLCGVFFGWDARACYAPAEVSKVR